MEDIIKEYKLLDTSAVSDALDKLSIEGQIFGIQTHNSDWKVAGRAFTVKYEDIENEEDEATVGDFIDDVKDNEIIFLDNNGRLDCTVWGDILTNVAKTKGIGATIINGVCRDIQKSLDINYPIFSLGKYMRTGKNRVKIRSIGEKIEINKIFIQQGDIILGDSDGVLTIPKESEKEVLSEALKITKAENQIREAVKEGMRLDEAREKFNYHNLQKREC